MTSKSKDLLIAEEEKKETLASSSNQMDDETDSCFVYKKSHSQMYNKIKNKQTATDHESDHCAVVSGSPIITPQSQPKSKSLLQVSIPHVARKTSPTGLVAMPNIVSVKHTLAPTVNPIIDKIANNLKNKMLQEKPIPKVSLVNKVNNNNNLVKVGYHQSQPKPAPKRNILDDESLNKLYAHKLILHRLNQNEAANK